MEVQDDALLSRLRQLVDKDDIQKVLFDYAFYLDMNMTKELAELFTDDCYVAYGPGFGADGIEEYKKTLEGVGTFFAATSHHVSNVVITFADEDTVESRSSLLAWHKYNRDRPDGYVLGQYHDRLIRTPYGWRFTVRELRHTGTINFHTKPENQTMIGRHS
jgi:3-phenylpropionate/cinnamic acid dioxygenase small subunit